MTLLIGLVPLLAQIPFLLDIWRTGIVEDRDFTFAGGAVLVCALGVVFLIGTSLACLLLGSVESVLSRDWPSGRAMRRVMLSALGAVSLVAGIALTYSLDVHWDIHEAHWRAEASEADSLTRTLSDLDARGELPANLNEESVARYFDLERLRHSLEIVHSTDFETTNGFAGNRWILRARVGPFEEDLWLYYPNGHFPDSPLRFGDWAYYDNDPSIEDYSH